MEGEGAGDAGGGGAVETLSDIQTYLATFNKEIQPESGAPQISANEEQDGKESAGTTVAVDQTDESGQHYQFIQGDVTFEITHVNQEGEEAQASTAPTDDMPPTLQAEPTEAEVTEHEDIDNSQPLLTPAAADVSDAHQVALNTSNQEETITLVSQAGDTIITQSDVGMELADNSDAAVQVLASVAATSIPQAQPEVHGGTQLVAVQNAQDSSQPEIVAVSNDNGEMVTVQSGETVINEAGELQVLANVSDQIQNADSDQQESSVILNTGSSYQTVTIVPSEVNQGGEVSYVLIVSQPENEQVAKDEDGRQVSVDMSVYDFKEEKGGGDGSGERKKGVSPRKLPHGIAAQLMCNYCNYTSPKRYLLTRHMKTHSEERPHKCNICDRGFKTIASLQNHINTHTGTRPHKCKECEAAFTTSGELVRHVRYRHTFEKPHKCTECDYSSVELSKLKRHMRSHTGERPYQCPHCSYASPDTYKLKRHLRIHTGEKPYECDVCHARFTQSNSLKAHRLIHTGNKPIYQCDLCPTTCGRKTDLKIHVQKLHTSDKPLQCKKCGKSFPDRYSYKIHLKTHDGEKCFKCDMCPYAALSQRHLESHLLTHTGEKPFTCDECDLSFRQKQLLKRHKNLYHTPDYVPPEPREKTHECSDCNKVFAHRGNLLRHMALHDPDNAQLYVKMEGNESMSSGEEEEMLEEAEQNGVDIIDASTNEVIVHIQEVPANAEQVAQDGSIVQPERKKRRGRPRKNETTVILTGKNAQQILMAMEEPEAEEPEETEAPNVVEAETPPTPGRRSSSRRQRAVSGGAGDAEQEEMELKVEKVAIPVTPRGRGRPPKIQQVQIETQKPQEVIVITPAKRGRGRPPASAATQVVVEESVEPVVQEVVAEEEVGEDGSPRTRSKRKTPSSPEVDNSPTKKKKVETPKRGRKKAEEPIDDDDDEERKRAEQKKKDIETCFGFDLGEEEVTTVETTEAVVTETGQAAVGEEQQQMVVITVEGLDDQVQTVDLGSILQVQQNTA